MKEREPYLIPTQKRKRLTKKKLFEFLYHLSRGELPEKDAKYLQDIYLGLAMYEIPLKPIHLDLGEKIHKISFTTDWFNQMTCYLTHKYGLVNGCVMIWFFWAYAQTKGKKEKLKNILLNDAKTLLKTRDKKIQKQGEIIMEFLKQKNKK